MQLTLLDPDNPAQAFPDPERALTEPNGLLAWGGCLSARRLLNAYRHGIFPWYNPGEPILWWSPNPRLVLYPERLNVSRSLQKTLRRNAFEIRYDHDFAAVIAACAAPRPGSAGTWLTQEMRTAYRTLHRLGVAHSAEAWQDGQLVGGLYGLAIGRVFFGESMFHHRTDASKAAFVTLVRQLAAWDYRLIDCQVSSGHLLSFGAEEIDRDLFGTQLRQWCAERPAATAWRP